MTSDGRTVVLQGDIKFHHYGGKEYQSEVMLLSRSIVLQGSPAAESRKKGGHVKIMGSGRIQGVMAYRMGQRNVNGNYPFHFHKIGWVSGTSYVMDSSVYHSFYRGYVVHGTHNLALKVTRTSFTHPFYLFFHTSAHATLDNSCHIPLREGRPLRHLNLTL